MSRHTLVGGEVLINVHDEGTCVGEHCCIHRPSDHHMADWPQHFRSDRGIMERICEHGVGHPDPDDPTEDTTHGCDFCCSPPIDQLMALQDSINRAIFNLDNLAQRWVADYDQEYERG